MTSPGTTQRRARSRFPKVPTGTVIASVDSYEAARGVVDRLAKQDFPVSTVSIVGTHLNTVERVTGRMSIGKAALGATGAGVMLGMFVGLLVLITNPEVGLGTLLALVLVAIGFSVLWNVIGYAINPQRRQFTSVMQVIATHFDVVAPVEFGERAKGLLAGGQSAQAPAKAPAEAQGHLQPPVQGQAAATEMPAQPQEPQQPVQPQAPAAPPRTYGEAQAELRREREREARRAREQG